MALSWIALGGLAALAGVRGADDMGPSAFLWPPDREWSSQSDNTPPCGSASNAGNRTKFPLSDGKVGFVSQDDSYKVHLSISYNSDPQELADFETLIDPSVFASFEPGHACLSVPDAPPGVRPGDLATLQIVYVSDFDSNDNQTFYACADIQFVDRGLFFSGDNLCFNATDDTTQGNPHDPDITEFPGPKEDTGRGLSKGGIAGIVIGALVAVGLLGIGGFFLYRNHRQKTRLARQLDSVGGKWAGDNRSEGRESASQGSIRMQNLGPSN